jgi:hypothetical protein
MSDLSALFPPGTLVRHPGQPDWGTGQVQSATGHRVTVTFPGAGKIAVDATIVPLILVAPAIPPS